MDTDTPTPIDQQTDDTPPVDDTPPPFRAPRRPSTMPAATHTFPSDAWAGDGKARTDPHALSVTLTGALRPLDPARREAVLDAARHALLDPQALALVVAVRKGGAGTLSDFEAALALARHVLG